MLIDRLTDETMAKVEDGMVIEEALDRVTEGSAEVIRNLVRLNVQRRLLAKE